MSTGIPILLYHSICDDASPRFQDWSVHPELFAAHMEFLHSHCYTPITVTQLTTAMTEDACCLPDRPVVITFDDGFADFCTDALPVLQQHHFVATLYIITGLVGGTSRWLLREGEGDRPMLTWDQIAMIDSGGVECGTHSHTHLQLDTLPAAVAHEEITRSKSVLEQHLGRQVSTFAYPHGYHSSAVLRLVKQAGYSSACAVKNAMSAETDDRFALSRIIILNNTSVESFAALLAGQGLRIAPVRERVATKGWRIVRRSAGIFKQRPTVAPQLGPQRKEWNGN
jgi:peptidoglycan/xylan/chitin deacetylase (PgdA/CDA1 family)